MTRGALWAALAATGCGPDRLSVFDQEVLPVPRLRFVNPGAAGAVADESVRLEVEFSDVSSGDTWTLFYLSDASSSRGGKVAEDLAAAAGPVSLSWVTAELPSGAYHLFAELESSGGTATASAPGPVRVEHSGDGNAPPTVRVVSPNGGEQLDIGGSHAVSWTASDPDGDSLTAAVQISRDSGTSWTTLEDGVTDDAPTATLDWEVSDAWPEGNSYRLRVTVDDGRSGTAADVSDADFAVVQPANWAVVVSPMMARSCGGALCHSTGGSYAYLFDSDQPTTAAGTGVSQMTDRVIARSITVESMPPAGSGYPALSAADKAKFLEWIANGTP